MGERTVENTFGGLWRFRASLRLASREHSWTDSKMISWILIFFRSVSFILLSNPWECWRCRREAVQSLRNWRTERPTAQVFHWFWSSTREYIIVTVNLRTICISSIRLLVYESSLHGSDVITRFNASAEDTAEITSLVDGEQLLTELREFPTIDMDLSWGKLKKRRGNFLHGHLHILVTGFISYFRLL